MSAADCVKVSPVESASSRETWPLKDLPLGEAKAVEEVNGDGEFVQTVVFRVGKMDQIQIEDVAKDGLDVMAKRMRNQSEESLEQLKAELRGILSGRGGPAEREQFAQLQKILQSRRDLSPEALMQIEKTQLQILVAIKMGIQAFLHPDIDVTQSVLIEIFFQIRCRNMACQSLLPVDGCKCKICQQTSGFCKACMCVICSKFDFDVNTCRWVGCDFCSHWAHADCAIRVGQISMGSNQKKKIHESEMIFKCKACSHTSELFGWVRDVFKACASIWDRDGLMRELDCVRRIFHGSEDESGKRLYWKSEELLQKLKCGMDHQAASEEMQNFFQDMQIHIDDDIEDGHGKAIEPRKACDHISEVVQEAVHEMEIVAADKVVDLKRARLALELCDRELDEKRRELGELHFQKERKKQELDELESIVRLKQAEAEMFQLRADEARQEADRLKTIAQARQEKNEEDYASKYLKLRLDEAEAERRYLFEKIKLQEYSRSHTDASEMVSMCKLQYLIDRANNFTNKESPNHKRPSTSNSQG